MCRGKPLPFPARGSCRHPRRGSRRACARATKSFPSFLAQIRGFAKINFLALLSRFLDHSATIPRMDVRRFHPSIVLAGDLKRNDRLATLVENVGAQTPTASLKWDPKWDRKGATL